MNLLEFYNNNPGRYNTDKDTTHDYIRSYYNNEFTSIRSDEIRILEIGIASGGSIKLWADWFVNGNIYGVDVANNINEHVNNTILYFNDAYVPETLLMFEDNFFDYIIDDGPHTLESQLNFIKLWFSKIKSGGKLIIEDVQDADWIPLFESYIEKLKASGRMSPSDCEFKTFDFRANKNRYDDIIFEITKL